MNLLASALILLNAPPLAGAVANPEPDAPRLEMLVHAAATDLTWSFDLEEASVRAREQGKPVLVYLRCLSGFEAQVSAQRELSLPQLGFDDDGYAKDVLFRASVLSDERVAQLIERRFSLVCSTYGLQEVYAGDLDNNAHLTTPALVALSPNGLELGRLDRVGVLSADRVDAWLRELVADPAAPLLGRSAPELFFDGELELLLRVTRFDVSGEARLWRSRSLARLGRLAESEAELEHLGGAAINAQKARIATRRGQWRLAARAWADVRRTLDRELHAEATFGLAWAKTRLGDHGVARALWYSMLSESALGRRAAACLLRDGPKLALASSSRGWIPKQALSLEPNRSIRALCELQQADGSFTATLGFSGEAWCDPAITALALSSLRAWQARTSIELQGAALSGAQEALDFLKRWASCDELPRGVRAFNEPYVLRALLAEGESAAAQRIVQRMRSSQLPSGGWSAYGDGWSVSFLTASGVLAWLDARAHGLDVPEAELRRALDALEFLRTPEGNFAYSHGPGRSWMSSSHGSIARDPLCELALYRGGRTDLASLEAALSRYCTHAHELAAPTKRLDRAYDERGHGSYHFFYGHANAVEAAWYVRKDLRSRVEGVALGEILEVQEADGTFLDHWMLGRAYATAMALRVASEAGH